MKKIITLVTILLLSFTIVACTEEPTTITLPDLSGLNKEQVSNLLNEIDIEYTFEDIIDNTKTRNRFVEYKGDFNIGDEVAPGSKITIIFAIHANVLPDLSGVHLDNITGYFTNMNLFVEIRTLETNSVPEGQFVKYLEPKYIGQVLEDNTTVVIYIAKNFVVVERNLIISKYIEGATTNRAIELYNFTNEIVDLSDYKVGLFLDGSQTVSQIIELEGHLNPLETFVISHTGSNDEIRTQADLITDKLIYNGNDTVTLLFSNDEVVDTLGNIGWSLNIFNNVTLYRKASMIEPKATYNSNDWNSYGKDYFEHLGSHPVIYPTTFTWDLSYSEIPFNNPGGMTKVTFISNNDGDTAQFLPDFTNDNRVRFVGINTPETGSGLVAIQARQFVYQKLKNALNIYIQHDPETGLYDTYGRILGLVWYDGKLLNYELVLNGYSQNNYSDDTQSLTFNGIPLAIWMANAEAYAKQNRLGIWG